MPRRLVEVQVSACASALEQKFTPLNDTAIVSYEAVLLQPNEGLN